MNFGLALKQGRVLESEHCEHENTGQNSPDCPTLSIFFVHWA